MNPCNHRITQGISFACTHPDMHLPRQVVWANVCNACKLCDNGVRTVEPKRLGDTPRGLGDTASDALKIIGIEQKPGCGCSARQSWLNQRVSYERLPTLARQGKAWATWLCKLLRIKTGMEPQRILFRFAHGLGDAVQFTAVLRALKQKYPRANFDVVVKRGQHTLFDGLVRHAFAVGHAEETDTVRPSIDGRELVYDHEHTIAWHEPDACYADSPSTKVEKCLREAFDIPPALKTRYEIQVGREAHERAVRYMAELGGPAVLIHYQGNSAPSLKSLKTPDVLHVAKVVRELGYEPVLLDWDRRSRIVKEGRHPWIHNPGAGHWLWPEGIGDGETIAAIARLTRLNIGIDSGPGKVFEATTGTPAIVVWTRMHPVHYSTPAYHVTHLVPDHHRDYLRGDKDAGQRFFEEHYRFATYRRNKLREGLLALVRTQLAPIARETVV